MRKIFVWVAFAALMKFFNGVRLQSSKKKIYYHQQSRERWHIKISTNHILSCGKTAMAINNSLEKL